jgi:transcriptional regulator
MRAMVGLELVITRIEAKRKLSQNRSAADVAGVIDGLAAGSGRARAVAAEMRRP